MTVRLTSHSYSFDADISHIDHPQLIKFLEQ
jgi:hypothetical protein